MRRLACSVLVFEAVVVFFATLVAVNLAGWSAAWAVGGTFAVAFLLTCGFLRWRVGYVIGSALQIALIASGVLISAMFFLGAVFTLLWILALRVGARVDEVRAAGTGQGSAG